MNSDMRALYGWFLSHQIRLILFNGLRACYTPNNKRWPISYWTDADRPNDKADTWPGMMMEQYGIFTNTTISI